MQGYKRENVELVDEIKKLETHLKTLSDENDAGKIKLAKMSKGSVTIQVGTTFCGKTENPKGGGGVKAKNCAKIRGIQVFSCFSFRLLFHHGRTFIFNRVINLWLNFLI